MFLKFYNRHNKDRFGVFRLLVSLCLVPLSLAVLSAQADGYLVKGNVSDAETGEPLIGVNIMLKGSSSGSITDVQGRFSLKVPSSMDTLLFSYIGYISAIVPIEGRSNIDVDLRSSASELDEVVVVGYGTVRRSDVTSAVSRVENLEQSVQRPITHTNDLLQGNVAGVNVIRQGGDPSQLSRVIIRGEGTLGSEGPLYVVDGAPYYGASINPRDIETIDVLKDASAAAIYGAQASSGVIVITTKKGQTDKPKFELDIFRGYQAATNLPEALRAEEYAKAYRDAAAHAGQVPADAHDPLLNPWGQVTRTVWMDEIFRTAKFDNLNFRASGRSERLNYSTSIGYHNEEGILRNTGHERLSWRLRTDFKVTDRIRFGQNIYLSHISYNGTNTTSEYSGSVLNAIFMNPAAPVYDAETRFHGTVPFELSQFAGAYGDTYNPVALLERPVQDRSNFDINGLFYGEVDLLAGLTFRSSFNATHGRNSLKRFSPRVPEIGRSNVSNSLRHNESKSLFWVWDQQLTYQRSFGRHQLNATGVYSTNYRQLESFGVNFREFDKEDDWFQYIRNANDNSLPGNSNAWEDVLTSTIGRVMYSYDDRYFLNGSVRQDKTSRLPKDTRTDIFPSLSGAWKISSERFFNIGAIDLLKLRASWGEIGNIQSVGFYAASTPLGQRLSLLGEPTIRPISFFEGEVANPNLSWERSETYNVGLDLHLLESRVVVNVDYYEKYTRGLILRNAPNTHQGLANGPLVNAGDVSNKGIELSASYRGRAGRLSYQVGGNFSFNENLLESLDNFDNDVILHGDDLRGTVFPFRSTVGQPLYSFFLVPNLGIFQSEEEIANYSGSDGQPIQPNARPGDLKFQDVNGDGMISDEDRVYMGNTIPKFNYGLSFALAFGDFDLSALLQGVGEVQQFLGYKYTAFNASLQGYNLDRRVLDAWRPDNPGSDIPVLSTRDPNNNFGTASDWYLHDASYLRIRNLTLGYTAPSALMSRLGSNVGLRAYFSVDNLLTMSRYPGIDPEIGGRRMDNGFYPQPRTFTAGLNFSF